MPIQTMPAGASAPQLLEGEHDFRLHALRETRRLAPAGAEPSTRRSSLCLPVEPGYAGPLPVAGQGAWRTLGIMLAGIAAGWAASGWIAGSGSITGLSAPVLLGCVAAGVFGAALDAWIAPRWRTARLLRRLAAREGSLLRASAGRQGMEVNVWEPDRFSPCGAPPADYGFCQFDNAARRLVIEGLRHRYVIRAEDVVEWQMRGNAEMIAVEIAFHVGMEPLRLVFGRREGSQPVANNPLFYLLYPHRNALWLSRRMVAAIGRSP